MCWVCGRWDAEFFQMPRRYYSFIHQMMLVFLIVCHTIPIFEAVHTLQRLEWHGTSAGAGCSLQRMAGNMDVLKNATEAPLKKNMKSRGLSSSLWFAYGRKKQSWKLLSFNAFARNEPVLNMGLKVDTPKKKKNTGNMMKNIIFFGITLVFRKTGSWKFSSDL